MKTKLRKGSQKAQKSEKSKKFRKSEDKKRKTKKWKKNEVKGQDFIEENAFVYKDMLQEDILVKKID